MEGLEGRKMEIGQDAKIFQKDGNNRKEGNNPKNGKSEKMGKMETTRLLKSILNITMQIQKSEMKQAIQMFSCFLL